MHTICSKIASKIITPRSLLPSIKLPGIFPVHYKQNLRVAFNLCKHFELSYSRNANKNITTGVYITINEVHSTYANILKNRYKKVRKNYGIS